jgi:outer membrane biogenesis lipoprotein LolB
MMFMKFGLSLLAFFLLLGCSSFPKKNQDPNKDNPATFNKDLKECKEDYPEAGSGVHVRQWENCMNLKGWK